MTVKKINIINISKRTTIFNKLDNKKLLLVVLLLPVLFIAVNSQNLFAVNAQSSSNNVIQQSQSNTQSNTQSTSNNSNCSNIQSQTTVNGKTTTTSKNICGDNTSSSSSPSGNPTLKGIIASAEYNPNVGVIINSVFGNWTLTTKGDNSKDFKASFIVQPVSYTNFATSTSTSSNLNQQTKTLTNTTAYLLSNFFVNSVIQQNSDITYVGKIDVVQSIHPNDLTRPDETNIFKGKAVSISIIGDRVLIINFDKQSNLFNVFKNTPLVGLVTS